MGDSRNQPVILMHDSSARPSLARHDSPREAAPAALSQWACCAAASAMASSAAAGSPAAGAVMAWQQNFYRVAYEKAVASARAADAARRFEGNWN